MKGSRLILTALIVSAVGMAAESDHRAPKPPPKESGASSASQSSSQTPTRQELLVQGFLNSGISTNAMAVLQKAFRETPNLDAKKFEQVLSRVNQENKGLLSDSQIDGLKRVYEDALAGVSERQGEELSDAVSKALEQAPKSVATPKKATLDKIKEPTQETKFLPEAEKTPAASGKDLSPEGIQDFLRTISAQLAGAFPRQDLQPKQDSSGNDIAGLGMLGALRNLLGKDGGKGDGKDDRGGRPQFNGQGAGNGGDPGRNSSQNRKEDKSKDDSIHRPEPRRNNNNNNNNPPPSPGATPSKDGNGGQNQKPPENFKSEDKKKKPEPVEEDEPKKEEPKAPANGLSDDLKSALDSAANLGPRSSLGPISSGGGGFGSSNYSGPSGSFGLGGGMGGIGGMSSGGGGGGSGALSGPDPFGGVGMEGGGYGAVAGPNMGSGYMIAKDGGYGGVGGGGSVGEAISEASGDSGMDEYTSAAPNRIATVVEQVRSTKQDKSEGPSFLVKEYQGWVGGTLCKDPERSKWVGFCKGIQERKEKAAFYRRMEAAQAAMLNGN